MIAVADVLELEDGRVVVGTYVDGTADYILFEVEGDVVAYPVGDVKSMGLAEAEPPPAEEGKPAPALVVPAGTRLLIRTSESIDSRRHKTGHMFSARLEGDLNLGGVVVAPNGAKVYGRVTEAKRGGNIAGKAELGLQLSDLTVDGKPYQISTSSYKAVTQGEGRRTVGRTLAGAAIGGLIDGSSGAKTGAKVGGGVSIITGGEQINVPANTILEFVLAGDLVIR
jgi:hypothetical protein